MNARMDSSGEEAFCAPVCVKSKYAYLLVREVPATYAPFVRVEVVGAVAEVFHEAERHGAVGDEHEAARSVCG